mgnify:CR=1 FL=1
MKRVILLALVLMLLLTTGCTFIDKLSIGLRATEFFTAWVAQNEDVLEDALTVEVTYNESKMSNSELAENLAKDEWWTNYVTVGDKESVTDMDGGKATVTYEFTVMEKEKPGTEEKIRMVLLFTKSDWASWKIYSVDIAPIWFAL